MEIDGNVNVSSLVIHMHKSKKSIVRRPNNGMSLTCSRFILAKVMIVMRLDWLIQIGGQADSTFAELQKIKSC